MQVGIFPNFQINGEALLPECLCLIWLKVTIFSLSATLCFFYNFKWFNINAALTDNPVIQREVDELLGKGVAGFYSNIFVISKYTGGIPLILNLVSFNQYMHIATLKMPTIRQVWELIQQGSYALSIDLQGHLFTYSCC